MLHARGLTDEQIDEVMQQATEQTILDVVNARSPLAVDWGGAAQELLAMHENGDEQVMEIAAAGELEDEMLEQIEVAEEGPSAYLARNRDAFLLPDLTDTSQRMDTRRPPPPSFQRPFGGLGAVVASPVVAAESQSVLIQESPLAGFQFHRGEAVWSSVGVGATVKLVREPNNSHDTNAVAVYYQNHKLGYVLRGENSAIAQMLDRGERLKATITQLSEGEDPWGRIRFNISLV